MNSNTASTSRELAILLNTIMNCWKKHPNHFGYQSFDEFLKSLPDIHQQFVYYQHVQYLRLKQQHQQQLDMMEAKKEENLLQVAQRKRNYKKSRSTKPTLEPIEEENLLTVSSFPASTSSKLPSPTTEEEKLNAFAQEFIPNKSVEKPQKTTHKIVSYRKLEKFVPFHAARAKLNIYIPKQMTKSLLSMINESFPNSNTLYYYLDISTAIQINDAQMDVIQTENHKKVVIINFDLHEKTTGEVLYAFVIQNDENRIEMNTHKWLWKLDEFLTANEIFNKYEIVKDDLPISSRLMKNGIYQQFNEQKMEINQMNYMSLLKEYKWGLNEIKIVGSSQKCKKKQRNEQIKVLLESDSWINLCIKSLDDEFSLIPIVVYENSKVNRHWIEWVKFVCIKEKDSFVALSFKYNDAGEWEIGSIFLDRGDIYSKHRLIGLQCNDDIDDSYDEYFCKFNTSITSIEWR